VTASLAGGDLVLQGHPVRTHKAYSAPLTIDCEVELEARVASDGFFGVGFVALGEPPDNGHIHLRWLQMACRGPEAEDSRDGFSFLGRDGILKDKLLWGEEPFPIKSGKVYSIRLEVTEDQVRIIIDGRTYDLKDVKIPYKEFYIYLLSWQPTNRWHVRNFVVR
jgi:hypothetical protein